MTGADLHPSAFIDELSTSRGWTRRDLAERMHGDADVNLVLLDTYSEMGHADSRMRLGITAANLSEAFGLPITFFVRLEALWLASARP